MRQGRARPISSDDTDRRSHTDHTDRRDLARRSRTRIVAHLGERAGQVTATFDTVLADARITVCKIPPRSPRANAYAERFVLTARTEVTDRMLILNQRHLRQTLDEYARHYNGHRVHRALQLRPPHDPTVPSST